MTKIIPFKAVRPPRDKVYLVASRPYYTYKKRILNAKLSSNKYTFLHVINPEFNKDDKTKPNTIERFQKVRNKYEDFFKNGYFFKDEKESLYIYEQIYDGNVYIGVIAGTSVEEYLDGRIKIHEHTITQREQMFKKYLDVCKFHAEPVLLTYEDHPGINALLDIYIAKRAEYEFTTTDDKTHRLWLVNDKAHLNQLITYFSEVEDVYIADGHHRSASSVLYAKNSPKGGNHDHFLSFLIAQSKLRIYDYNRVVSSLNGLSEADFLSALEKSFTIEKTRKLGAPCLHSIGMLLGKTSYKISLKPELVNDADPIKSLDAQILEDFILKPILDIKDLKTDDRVHFVSGPKGVKGIKRVMKKEKGKVAFILKPVKFDQLKRVSDHNLVMPPKSTWIEPKLRSGLTIYEYE